MRRRQLLVRLQTWLPTVLLLQATATWLLTVVLRRRLPLVLLPLPLRRLPLVPLLRAPGEEVLLVAGAEAAVRTATWCPAEGEPAAAENTKPIALPETTSAWLVHFAATARILGLVYRGSRKSRGTNWRF